MIDDHAFEAAAQLLHTSYSDKPWEGREAYADRIWARGTLKAAIEKLALTDVITDAEKARVDAAEALADANTTMGALRHLNLGLSETLTTVWKVAGGDQEAGFGVDTPAVVERVRYAIQRARTEAPKIEITDAAVESVGTWFWGTEAFWSREALRTALANALQTR